MKSSKIEIVFIQLRKFVEFTVGLDSINIVPNNKNVFIITST